MSWPKTFSCSLVITDRASQAGCSIMTWLPCEGLSWRIICVRWLVASAAASSPWCVLESEPLNPRHRVRGNNGWCNQVLGRALWWRDIQPCSDSPLAKWSLTTRSIWNRTRLCSYALFRVWWCFMYHEYRISQNSALFFDDANIFSRH